MEWRSDRCCHATWLSRERPCRPSRCRSSWMPSKSASCVGCLCAAPAPSWPRRHPPCSRFVRWARGWPSRVVAWNMPARAAPGGACGAGGVTKRPGSGTAVLASPAQLRVRSKHVQVRPVVQHEQAASPTTRTSGSLSWPNHTARAVYTPGLDATNTPVGPATVCGGSVTPLPAPCCGRRTRAYGLCTCHVTGRVVPAAARQRARARRLTPPVAMNGYRYTGSSGAMPRILPPTAPSPRNDCRVAAARSMFGSASLHQDGTALARFGRWDSRAGGRERAALAVAGTCQAATRLDGRLAAATTPVEVPRPQSARMPSATEAAELQRRRPPPPCPAGPRPRAPGRDDTPHPPTLPASAAARGTARALLLVPTAGLRR